ncbi:MazG nucleotide pyrophosphohydrolase domain-containing protein [Amphritea sp. HPY]|uniref:MazG nucleotide pyrophosphohydrolase domain-containing protein n=1 Tax=Amphritea sp. HPY TaxID=3421652 RepID=UPI003D7E7700
MSDLTLNAYQKAAHTTAAYGPVFEYPFGSLAEEAGEVMGKLNKFCRKHKASMRDAVVSAMFPSLDVHEKLREDLTKELGDLLWQVQECAGVLGLSLEDIAQMNLGKLSGRAERGTIDGEGDDR